MSGAWVSRARLAASLGRPMPTKQVMSLFRARAAVMLIISEEVNSRLISRCSFFGGFLENVFLQPGLEGLAVTGDAVPLLIEGVVPVVVTKGVRRPRTPRRHCNGGNGPRRNHAGVHAGAQVVDDFFHGNNAALGGQHRFFLDADDAFHQYVALAVGTLGV